MTTFDQELSLPDPLTENELNGVSAESVLAAPGNLPKKGKSGKKKKGKKNKDRLPLGTSRGIETMFRTSYLTHVNLSAMADNKANIMISINGIIMSILIASISPKIDTNPWLLIPTSVLLITCLISIIFAVLAARPRVQPSTTLAPLQPRRKAGILFFGQFTALREEDFVDNMVDLLHNLDALYESMIRDIYSLGQALARKFRLLRVSYTVFMIGLAAGVILYIVVFVGLAVSPPPTAIQTLP